MLSSFSIVSERAKQARHYPNKYNIVHMDMRDVTFKV